MSSPSAPPLELVIASYADHSAAQGDWSRIRDLIDGGAVAVEGLALVHRREDGRIRLSDDHGGLAKYASWGGLAGAAVGLVFPPALLAGALVGVAAGLGVGALRSHGEKRAISLEVETALPIGSTGIVALLEPSAVALLDPAVASADAVTRCTVDGDSVRELESGLRRASAADPTG